MEEDRGLSALLSRALSADILCYLAFLPLLPAVLTCLLTLGSLSSSPCSWVQWDAESGSWLGDTGSWALVAKCHCGYSVSSLFGVNGRVSPKPGNSTRAREKKFTKCLPIAHGIAPVPKGSRGYRQQLWLTTGNRLREAKGPMGSQASKGSSDAITPFSTVLDAWTES